MCWPAYVCLQSTLRVGNLTVLFWAVIGWWQHLRMAFFRCHASLVHHWLFKHRNRHMIFLTACHNSLSLLICSHLLNLHEMIEKAWETGPGTVSRYFISAMVRELTEHWDWFTACGKRQLWMHYITLHYDSSLEIAMEHIIVYCTKKPGLPALSMRRDTSVYIYL